MRHFVTMILLLTMVASARAQQDAPIFQPPQAYDVHRYEAGWNKNPFTLKTVAPVVETESFARDLAIGTYYGDSANPTIIVVNTKTNERTSLRQDQPSASGMNLRSVSLGSSRKDVVAEITLGSETASIRYNDSYVKQMASAEMTKAPAAAQQSRQPPGTPSKFPPSQHPSPPSRAAYAAPPPVTALTGAPSGRPGYVRPSGTRNAASPREAAGGAPPAAPSSTQPAGANTASPLPTRRRLVSPVFNTMSLPQPPSDSAP